MLTSSPVCVHRVPALVSRCLLGAALIAPPWWASAAEQGFIEDATANLLLRNYYFDRDFRDSGATQSRAAEWAQGFILDARSGYTQGVVGFGIDVSAMAGFKLDSSPDRIGTGLLPRHDDGRAADDYGRAGLTLKAKIADTELKVGELRPDVPVLRADDGRLLPQTFDGAMLTSRLFDGLTLHGGQMRAVTLRNSSNEQDMSAARYAAQAADRFNYLGAEYRFNAERTVVGVWQAELQDIYRQRYFNLTQRQPLGAWTLGANLGYFIDSDVGSARAGQLDSKAWSGLFSANLAGHTFYAGLQRVSSGSGWMSLTGTSGKSLANDMFNNNFSNAGERSWQLRYDYNFVALGLPGLTSLVRYSRGSDVDTATVGDGREWERDLELAYTIQSGPLRNLNLRWRNSSVRRSFAENFDENRLILAYNFNLL